MRKFLVLTVFCACATLASAQVAEFSVSGGVSRFGDKSVGTLGSDIASGNLTLKSGFRLALRFTINSWRFMGHEFGYGYAHSGLKAAGTEDTPVPIHQGFYDFLLYATPEGSRVRPFATGGVQFSSFFPPGTSAYYGNQITKFGINYGAGIKLRVGGPWGVRLDIRQYNSGQPFGDYLPNVSGRLKQTEISAGRRV